MTKSTNGKECPVCGAEGYHHNDEIFEDVLTCPDKLCRIWRYFEND